MLRKLRSQLSYANVAATLALVIAVGGGTAYAAKQIRSKQIAYHAVKAPKVAFNAITTSKVRNGSLSGRDLREGSVTSSDVRNGTLRSDDFAAGQLPQGPKGDPGAPAAELHGTVTADGVLANGKSVTAVSAGGDGTYTITFDRDVSSCAVVATIASVDDAGSVSGAAVGAQQATFRTRNLAGAGVPRPFSFAVFC
jgi:hypothetical protein